MHGRISTYFSSHELSELIFSGIHELPIRAKGKLKVAEARIELVHFMVVLYFIEFLIHKLIDVPLNVSLESLLKIQKSKLRNRYVQLEGNLSYLVKLALQREVLANVHFTNFTWRRRVLEFHNQSKIFLESRE